MIRTFEIYYIHPQTRLKKLFKISGEDIDAIRLESIAKLKKIGVDDNEWYAIEITKEVNNGKDL